MSEIENRLFTAVAEFLNTNVVQPLVSYISENPDFTGKSSDEIATVIRGTINVPQNTITTKVAAAKPAVHGVAGLMPELNIGAGMPGLGGINLAAAKSKTVKGVKKEHPPQVWMTADAWQSAVAGGARICPVYSSSRVKDESKKDKVCGAAIDESITETDCFKWRCSQCKPEAVTVEKYIKKSTTGPIDPLASKPGSIAPSLTPKSSNTPVASALPMVPVASALPPVVETLEKLPSPKVQNVAKPMTPAPTLNLAKHPGLRSDDKIHFKADNEDLLNIVFNYDKTKGAVRAIGKYAKLSEGPATPHYEQHIEDLSDSERKALRRYAIEYEYTCVKPEVSASVLPTLPAGIKLPDMNLPSLAGLPGISDIPGIFGK